MITAILKGKGIEINLKFIFNYKLFTHLTLNYENDNKRLIYILFLITAAGVGAEETSS